MAFLSLKIETNKIKKNFKKPHKLKHGLKTAASKENSICYRKQALAVSAYADLMQICDFPSDTLIKQLFAYGSRSAYAKIQHVLLHSI